MMLLDDSGEAARCSAFETLIANMSHDMAKGNSRPQEQVLGDIVAPLQWLFQLMSDLFPQSVIRNLGLEN